MKSSIQPKAKGLIQIFTGSGKGKTSIANGMAIRAAGAGLRVAFVSFDKGGDFYHERKILERIDGIDLYPTGCVRFNEETRKFRFGVEEQDVQEGSRGLQILRDLYQQLKHDLIILDEINTSTNLGILKELEVLELIDAKPAPIELILTGRDCPESLMEKADLVSEVCSRKHYMMLGVPARKGLDY
ncbi:cob(I)yrinic acid a,c-diamide adenosyltransferase [Candidatus Uhrbacteria bacterium]|nr:cob(I)yrinic acid a,c-diamide adenosyltransferase [Candidatus Uhrbacteria bacterium]MBD3284420.1 cob(I)yrinic acid a,c-diamide adenosyltransferase [Candidatus Uhrbacteria bacterium]